MLVRLGFASVKGRTRNLAFLLTMTATFVAVGVLQWPLVPVVLVVTPLSIAAAWPRKDADKTADKAADA
jgi:chromate transporter